MQTSVEPNSSQRASFQLENLAALGAHSAGLAHELRNAMVPIKTLVQVLLERHPDVELGSVAGRELSRIDSLLDQMLSLASPPSSQRETVRIHELLAYCLRLLESPIETQRVSLKSYWNAAADRVQGNSHQLQQAVMNLVLNALEAMSPGGVLTLTTRNICREEGAEVRLSPAASHISIEVGDTGCGVLPEHLSRLFDPFFTTKAGGTGLGLHLTRRIIEDHQGSISVESHAGKGTTFTLLLPVDHAR